MANHSALLAKEDHGNYGKFNEFVNDLPGDRQEQFKALITEGKLVTQMALQASLNVADTAAKTTDTFIIMSGYNHQVSQGTYN